MRQVVATEMEQYNTMLREAIQSQQNRLGLVSRYLLSPSGKQMRPLLTLLTAKLHGEINSKSYSAAMLFEMLHWATLIHDDVVDEAYIRRGELTLGAMIRSKSAVLVGDYLFTKGLSMAARTENFQAIVAATRTIEEVVEGELMQSEHASKLSTTREDYFEIIRLKTAVLIASASQSGAESVGATQEQIADMYALGEMIGFAFQIQDDILDFSSTQIIGKAKYNDLRERKITLPLIYAMEKSGKVDALRHLRRASTDPRSLEWLVSFIKKNGGIEHSQNVMRELHGKAIEILDKYPDSEVKRSLIEFCDYVIGRKK